jgi:hypothetical protein
MKQYTLFEQFDQQQRTPARARHSDPVTSKVAATNVESSGSADSDRAAILKVIRTVNRGPDGFPRHGWTAGEIAARLGDGWDNVKVSRRTVELQRAGDVVRGLPRMCTAKGSLMLTWHPIE